MFENPSPKGDEQKANVEAEPVEANVDGQETQESSERQYTAAQTETIVKDRLVREQKKFAKEKAELEKQLSEFRKTKSPSPNVEDDFKAKLTAHEAEKTTLTKRLEKYRDDSLRGAVERKLNEHGCLDPELVFETFKAKGLVQFDEEDNLVVDNVSNSLDDLVKTYLATKPHLVKSSVNGGVGTKGPKTPDTTETLESLAAKLGISPKKKSVFN